MANICVVGARKGGVGKSTIAYEVANVLDAILLDLDWDAGAVSRTWGYRHEMRATDNLLRSIETGRTPNVLKGFRKPRLVPHSPELVDLAISAEDWQGLILDWAEQWGSEWVVIDTHPGASTPGHGAMAAAHVILSPFGLRTNDLAAAEQIVAELADYPLALVPNFVPRIPPAAEVQRLAKIVENTPVQVAPFIPNVPKIGTRKRRMAITAEDPSPKAFEGAVRSFRELAQFVKEYVK